MGRRRTICRDARRQASDLDTHPEPRHWRRASPPAAAAIPLSTCASRTMTITDAGQWARSARRRSLVLVRVVVGMVGVAPGDHGPFALPFHERPVVSGFEGVVVVAER